MRHKGRWRILVNRLVEPKRPLRLAWPPVLRRNRSLEMDARLESDNTGALGLHFGLDDNLEGRVVTT